MAVNGSPCARYIEVMTHLVPEKRLDRNGRWVTRHVSSPRAASQKNSTLPAPLPHYYDGTSAVKQFMSIMNERGAGSDNLNDITKGLLKVNEETRIIVMTALDDYPDYRSTYILCYALQQGDEQFIRTVSLSAGFCSDYIGSILHRRTDENRAKEALSVLNSLHNIHKKMLIEAGEFEVSNYDSERDNSIANVFKAQCVANVLNLKTKVPIQYEYYKNIDKMIENMDLLEDTLYGIVDVAVAVKHWEKNGATPRKTVAFDANDAVAIAEVVRDYPHADDRLYNIIASRGAFDPELVRLSLSEDASPTLVTGML